ncbi:MAG: hypothetical protein K2Y22_02180 [Candidatus Obscuribacterales bacterium]|nr:hypothetical protein [Candidatus Obscuribacterales bacterium]
MQITRTSMISGIERTLEMAVTEEQLHRWQAGELIQKVMPDLDPADREFIMTGIVDSEWNDFADPVEPDFDYDLYDYVEDRPGLFGVYIGC